MVVQKNYIASTNLMLLGVLTLKEDAKNVEVKLRGQK